MMMMMTMKNQSTNEEGAKNFPRLPFPAVVVADDRPKYLYTLVFMMMMTSMMMTSMLVMNTMITIMMVMMMLQE